MEKIMKKTIVLLAVLLTMVLFPVIGEQTANAAEVYVNVPAKKAITLYSAKDIKNDKYKKTTYLGYISGKKVTNLKSSKPSVASVSKTTFTNTNEPYTQLFVLAKKPGTTTISFKVNSKTYKVKVTVKKYTNPISYIKIGTTKLSGSKFKNLSYCNLKYSKFANKKAKITIKLASGWTLDQYYDPVTNKTSPMFNYFQKGWRKSETAKNGSTIRIKGGKGFEINVYVTNKKTGQGEYVSIAFK